MSITKVKRTILFKSNKPLLRQFTGYIRKYPVLESVSENNIVYNYNPRQRKRRSFRRSNPASVIYLGNLPNMSSIIDLTKSDSDILVQPRKKAKRELPTAPNQRIINNNNKQQTHKRNIYKCNSLITIMPSDKLATASSEDLIQTNSYIFNSNYFYNIPASKDAAKAYVQAIQDTESAIQLKRTYPFTSVTNFCTPRSPRPEMQLDDNCCGDMQLDIDSDEEEKDKLLHRREQHDGQEEECEEMLLVDDVVKQIHNDTGTFQLDDNELSIYDLDIDSMMNIYDVSPDDKFDV